MTRAPEQLARDRIDQLLQAAGWQIQNMVDLNRNPADGVAVREFPLRGGPCDYLLFVSGKACGVVEAKKAGVTLSGVAEQSARYMAGLPEHLARWSDPLRFDVLTNIVGPPLGKVSIVPSSYPEWNINQAVAAFRPVGELSSEFLSIYLQSEVAKAWLRATAKTTTSQVNLAITTCRRLPVPIPPVAEQLRICSEVKRALSEAEAVMSMIRELSTRATAFRESILESAFSGRQVPQDPAEEPASDLLSRTATRPDGVNVRRGDAIRMQLA